MHKLEPVYFPSPYYDCYEASLMSILQYMGLPDEMLLMGVPAYFIFDPDNLSVYPRFHPLHHEWRRRHGLVIENFSIADASDARQQLMEKLDHGQPVCLPVDIYFLPHTSHYQHLHITHHLDIFGYWDHQYYVVSPYYRYQGWVDANVIQASLFSPENPKRCIIIVPNLKWNNLSIEQGQSLIRESCEYMTGLRIPEELAGWDPQRLGLAGILSFSTLLRNLAAASYDRLPTKLLELSAQIAVIGYSRHWLWRLIRLYEAPFLPGDAASRLEDLFSTVIPAWRALSMRFGAAIHTRDNDVVRQAAGRIEALYWKEYSLFNDLMGLQPGYVEGAL